MWYFYQSMTAHVLGHAGDNSKGEENFGASERHVHNESAPLWPAHNIKHPKKQMWIDFPKKAE